MPSGIDSDFGTQTLRRQFIHSGTLDLLYAFQNEKRVFLSAHHAMKQVVVCDSDVGVALNNLRHGFDWVLGIPHKHKNCRTTF